MSSERQPELHFFLARFDTIVQTSKQELSGPRKVAETVQQKEQLTSGCRSWFTDVCT